MTSLNPEQYYPVAFLVVTLLNLAGVAFLVASKAYRSKRREASERRISALVRGLAAGAESPEESGDLRRALRRASLREFRLATEQLAKERKPKILQEFSSRLEESGRLRDLLGAAGKGRKWRKIDALMTLGCLRVASAFLLLRRAVRSGDPDLVLAGVWGLSAWDSAQAIETLVSLLGKECPVNPSRVATAIEQSTADATAALLRKARSQDPVAQFWAAALLSRAEGEEAKGALVDLLRHGSPNVRAAAAASLGKAGDETTDTPLASALRDPEWVVRAQAARACGERRLARALPLLGQALRDREWWVRADAREAIEKIGPQAVDHLIPFLEDGDRFARNMAAEALENMGFVEAAIWDLSRKNGEREKALRVLRAIRKAEGSPALAEKIRRIDAALLEEVAEPLGLAGRA